MADRLEALVHYIVSVCRPDELGSTKLAKILWFSDVEYYRRTGRTITHADDYVKDDHGPRHRALYDVIRVLREQGRVAESPNLTPVGFRQELVHLELPDPKCFEADEIAIIDRVASQICRMSAKQASELTHDELWGSAYFGERIPVAAGAVLAGDIDPEIVEWAEAIANEDIAIAKLRPGFCR